MTGFFDASKAVWPKARRYAYSFTAVLMGMLAASVAAGQTAADRASDVDNRWEQLADPVFFNVARERNFNPVTDLAQDREGFIWIGTQGGLVRWDSVQMRTYRHDASDSHSLPQNFVERLHVDRDGRLWVGTTNSGAAYFDRTQDRFVRMPVGAGGTSGALVTAIEDDGDGGVWIGTNKGLDHIVLAKGLVEHVRADPARPDSLPNNSILAVLRDRDGMLWVQAGGGLFRRSASSQGNAGFTRVAMQGGASESLVASRLAQGSDGRIWIGTYKRGAFVLDPATGNVVQVSDGATADTQPSDRISDFLEARPGEMWIATFTRGLLVVDMATMKARRVRHDQRIAQSLISDSTMALLKDRSGVVWTGTEAGLSGREPQSAVLTIYTAYGNLPHLPPGVDAFSFLPMEDGRLWLGLRNGGAVLVDPAAPGPGFHSSIGDREPPRALLPGISVFRMQRGPQGVLYLATSNGLYYADQSGSSAKQVPWLDPKPNTLLRTMLATGNNLWVGGPSGLYRVDMNAPESAILARARGSEKLTDQRVISLASGPDGSIWVGTYNGLNRYDPATGFVEQIRPEPNNPHALNDGIVWSLYADRKSRLWVATGSGLALMTGRDGDGRPRFRHIGREEGAGFADGAGSVMEDRFGNIWCIGEGLMRIDGDTFAIHAMDVAQGVGIPLWNNAAARTSRGELLFAGVAGMIVVRPDRLNTKPAPIPVVITDARIGNKPVPASRFNAPESGNVPLTIAPEANAIAFQFAALDFADPKHKRYAVRLEGQDKNWMESDDSRRSASYTNLSPGDYRLRIRASGRAGAWMERELQVPIRILPAWYQTWWAWLAGVCAFLASVVAIWRVRMRALRLRQVELEEEVSRRVSELARVNVLLELHKSELTRFLAVASHDLRQPMHALNLYLGALSEEDIPERARPALANARRCALIMDDMFLALLDLSRLDAQVIAPRIEAFPIAALLSSIEVEFAGQARAKGLRLRVVRSSAWVSSDPALVEQMLRNLVANAVRYTHKGGIVIGCRRRGNVLRVAVCDTGIGISEEEQIEVFEEFRQLGNTARERTKGLGLGLAIVRRLANLLAVSVSVASRLGRGSIFSIDLAIIDPPLQAHPVASATEEAPGVSTDMPLAGKLVLVIDDDENILDAMRILLVQWGCSVLCATSVKKALLSMADSRRAPDAIICDDYLSPHENGMDAVALLREEFNVDVPALIVTGTVTPQRMQDLDASGLAVLHKPVTATVLHEALVLLMLPLVH